MPRILGLDFGTKRIGAALSDPRGQIATPLEVYERRTPKLDLAHYRDLISEEGIERIVIGLPVHTSGRESETASLARAFGSWLSTETTTSVTFYDERYTSREADNTLRSSGMKSKARITRRDMLAAQILLQAFLDAGSPEIEAPSAPLEDSGAS